MNNRFLRNLPVNDRRISRLEPALHVESSLFLPVSPAMTKIAEQQKWMPFFSGSQVALAENGMKRKLNRMTSLSGIVLMLAVLAGSIHAKAEDAVTIAVRPRVTTMGGTAQLKVVVPRNEANRTLVWEVDGPTFYRRSEIQLDGASAPRSYLFFVRDLPSGEFEIRATVKRNDDSTSVDRSDLRVLGPAS